MTGFTFHLIPHTHWDREWYLPESVLLPRLVSAVDDLLVRLHSDPDTKFLLDGQTILVEDYLRVRPESESELSELVRSGRLQVGPWYVLADELIPSGESLIRNLLAGQKDAGRLGGRAEVLYSPDAFGHPAEWPTLASEFGLRFGVIWRGLGGETGQERDLYRWRGANGREVLVYHLPPDGYEVGSGLPADVERLPAAWSRVRGVLVSRAATRHVAVFVGADHHAAHPALGRLRSLLGQIEPTQRVSNFPARRLLCGGVGGNHRTSRNLWGAALVLWLHLDTARRPWHPCPSQAASLTDRTRARPNGRATRGTGPGDAGGRSSAAAAPRLAHLASERIS